MSQVLRECAIGMLTAEMSTRAVAREFNVNFSTISCFQLRLVNLAVLASKPQTTCNLGSLGPSHRLRQATQTADKSVGLHNQIISAQTVRNHFREDHLHAHRPLQCLDLTTVWHRNRLQWENVHLRWPLGECGAGNPAKRSLFIMFPTGRTQFPSR